MQTCQLITQKTIKHPTELNRVPGRYWDEKSIDLFCPIPSKNHIVIIQDLATCYPVAKVARSTNAKSVIPVLEDIILSAILNVRKVTTVPLLIQKKH